MEGRRVRYCSGIVPENAQEANCYRHDSRPVLGCSLGLCLFYQIASSIAKRMFKR